MAVLCGGEMALIERLEEILIISLVSNVLGSLHLSVLGWGVRREVVDVREQELLLLKVFRV